MSPTRRAVFRAALGAAGALALPRHLLSAPEAPGDLDVALGAERWIRRSRTITQHGVVWPADPLKPEGVDRSLYNGFPGVVLFLLELHQSTGDRQHLEEAMRGASDLGSQLPATADAVTDAGLYTGLAGIAFVLEETSRASGEARFRTAALRALDLLHKSAKPAGAGVAWNDSADIISGSAGIGLYLLRTARTLQRDDSIALAARAGRRLIELGQPEHGGLKWGISPTVANRYPNFSHGAAGAGYFLATLFGATGEKVFLDGALAAARYLDAVARKDGDGWMVFHHEPDGGDLFYLSWCHGPPGTARLFHRLAEVTKDPSWQRMVERCAKGTLQTGIPEQRTPGFWNNISQCCGNAGVGEFFLTLGQKNANPAYAKMARRTADDIVARGTREGDGIKWVQSEHRVRPELLIAQTGFMQGAAGVGTFFLHLDAAGRGKKPAIVFPDNPFV